MPGDEVLSAVWEFLKKHDILVYIAFGTVIFYFFSKGLANIIRASKGG